MSRESFRRFEPKPTSQPEVSNGSELFDLDAELDKRGAFTFQSEQGPTTVALQLDSNSRRVKVIGSMGSEQYNFGRPQDKTTPVTFKADLSDAPAELRQAVLNEWEAAQTNQKVFQGENALPPAEQAKLQAKISHLEPIIAAMKAAKVPGEQKIPTQSKETQSVKPDESKKEMTDADKKAIFVRVFGRDVPQAVVEGVYEKDSFIVGVDGQAKIARLVRILERDGKTVRGWDAEIVGEQRPSREAMLSGMQRTAEFKRAVGVGDDSLFSALYKVQAEKDKKAQSAK